MAANTVVRFGWQTSVAKLDKIIKSYVNNPTNEGHLIAQSRMSNIIINKCSDVSPLAETHSSGLISVFWSNDINKKGIVSDPIVFYETLDKQIKNYQKHGTNKTFWEYFTVELSYRMKEFKNEAYFWANIKGLSFHSMTELFLWYGSNPQDDSYRMNKKHQYAINVFRKECEQNGKYNLNEQITYLKSLGNDDRLSLIIKAGFNKLSMFPVLLEEFMPPRSVSYNVLAEAEHESIGEHQGDDLKNELYLGDKLINTNDKKGLFETSTQIIDDPAIEMSTPLNEHDEAIKKMVGFVFDNCKNKSDYLSRRSICMTAVAVKTMTERELFFVENFLDVKGELQKYAAGCRDAVQSDTKDKYELRYVRIPDLTDWCVVNDRVGISAFHHEIACDLFALGEAKFTRAGKGADRGITELAKIAAGRGIATSYAKINRESPVVLDLLMAFMNQEWKLNINQEWGQND